MYCSIVAPVVFIDILNQHGEPTSRLAFGLQAFAQ